MRPRRILCSGQATGRLRRLAIASVAVLSLVACDRSSPTAPTTPEPDAPASNTHSLAGVVTDSADRAVADAEVEIVEGNATGRKVSSAEDGRYLLDGLDAGALTMAVSATGFSAKRVDVEVSGPTRVDVQLPAAVVDTPPPGDDPPDPADPVERVTIRGRVQSENSTPPNGARIEIASGPSAGRSTSAAPDGTYALADLERGAATLVAGAPGFISQTRAIELDDDQVVDFVLTPTSVSIAGMVLDALSGSGVGAVEVTAEGGGTATSDPAGAFLLTAAFPDPTTTWLTLRSGDIVERRTHAHLPGYDVEVSVIPASFDLQAFDEMLRTPALRRWREAPRLLIERRVVTFTSEAMTAGTASGDPMAQAESDALVTDLTWALPQLSGGHFGGFAGVELRTTDAGADAALLNDDVITVVRVQGLTDATGFWGFGRWQSRPDGTVTAGLIMIDAAFDAGTSPHRRTLRAHELGHALGYQHVTSRPSVMNPSAQLEPTDFDREACEIAFGRQPGNRAPDIDPVTVTINQLGPASWSRPIR